MSSVIRARTRLAGLLLTSAMLLASSASLPASGLLNGAALVDGNALHLEDALVPVAATDEAALVEALNAVRADRLDRALHLTGALVRRNPKFHLAQLVYGDLLLAKSQAISGLGNAALAPLERLQALREEARARLRHAIAPPPPDGVPASLLELATDQKRAVVVDIADARLYVFENRGGLPRRVADYYVSTGKNGPVKLREGDQRTPVGVYFVVTRLPGEELPDLYGAGALPISYPNEWDQRLGRTGYGIWLHGVPSSTYSRAPRASDGCIALPNADLKAIWNQVEPGTTPVVISNGIEWVDPAELHQRRAALLAQLERWRRDWQSLDESRYERNYSRDFRGGGGKDYEAWVHYKRRVNAAKDFIRVEISNPSVFAYPGERNLVVVDFDQDYRSSNFSNRMRKRQYWRREQDGVWRIVYEGAAGLNPESFQGIPYSARTRISRAD